MTYRLIEGCFVLGYGRRGDLRSSQPDGDSIWFRANDTEKWSGLSHRAPRLSRGKTVQLRFDGIDALELHYPSEERGGHQRLDLATAARDRLLAKIGFTDIEYVRGGHTVLSARQLVLPGHVLVRALDDTPGGRPIVLAYPGRAPERDGATIDVTPRRLRASLNLHLLRHGLAYPMLYTTMPDELRPAIRAAVAGARARELGLWADGVDRSVHWTRLARRDHLASHALWPKLYRRLHEFLVLEKSLAKLDDWLAVAPDTRDDEVIAFGSTPTRLGKLLAIDGERIKLRCDPLDVVVRSDALPGRAVGAR
jgi:endonuclease YncB( thermonuclease family)